MANAVDALMDAGRMALDRINRLLPDGAGVDWSACRAATWQRSVFGGALRAHPDVDDIDLDDLLAIDRQKAVIEQNTQQFVLGFPANNVLLWGARGTGKSSLIHALLNRYGDQGLRLIEVDKGSLAELPEIVDQVRDAAYRFVIVCDDLSFESDDTSYNELKSVLEGSVFR